MPRAVFWLLWETIQKGEPVGAYVKNMAKDGRYYWVFAIVTPIEGGYLSVRIKPVSQFLPLIEREYAALLAEEKTRRLKPLESAQILLSRLSEIGFRDYGSFMATALCQEIRARDEKLGRCLDKALFHFEGLTKEAAALLEYADGVVADYMAHRYVPFNLRVLAAKLGEAGATIGVLAMNYDALATALKTMFQAESTAGGTAPSGEIALLEEQRCSYEARAAGALRAIVSDAQLLSSRVWS